MDTAGKRLSIPGAAAVQDVRIAVVAGQSLEKPIWQPGILILRLNGTRQGMAIFPRPMCSPAATVWFSGSVNMGTNGVHPFLLVSTAAVVQFVPAKRSSLAKTIWQVGFQPLQKSGTQRKMARSLQSRLLPPAIKKSGGAVPKATIIRLLSPAAPSATVAVHTVPIRRCCQASTTSLQNIPRSQPSGIQP